MENKYYTPSIEEFHVGFEYELWEEDICEDYSWKQHVFTLNDMAESLHHETKHHAGGLLSGLEEEYIRVKYLDREDVESFGFTLVKEYSDELVFQINGGEYCFYELTLNIDDNKINIEQGCQSKMSAKKLPIEQWNYFNIFFGEIKNKSELQQVLKMIGVIQ